MTNHVARKICRAAANGGHCPFCDPTETEPWRRECHLWPSFVKEATAAIEGVRDYAMLTMRRKPRLPNPHPGDGR